ncbi:S-receptor-like serine/threonine-protein kinase [Parasponia andersonii]|uniref:Receptor-like serine/threonine-protein kinase n=1 Tax=Parasponia andersonii TaxID=3476 RepID=A0A2P5BIW1_PARAD|nr:S-receptor-like serine/threonine-protein kinase [Parasponia andersonii]
MGTFFIFLFSCAFLPLLTFSGPISVHFISPNFTATNFQFIDNGGDFLVSLNGTFKATITNPKSEIHRHYYLSVVHVNSSTVVWSANRDKPMSQSSRLSLTVGGLRVIDEPNHVIWSTPTFNSKVAALQLLETGNLVLVDDQNVRLWQSFDYPTNTIVVGQPLGVGKSLVGTRTGDDLSSGEYRLTVTDGDAMLQWKGITYWKLSRDIRAYKDSNSAFSFMEMNATGLFMLAGNGSTVAFNVELGSSKDFRIVKMGGDGRLSISSFIRGNLVEEFSAPSQQCQLPLVCGRLGLCSSGGGGATGSVPGNCGCPPSFYSKVHPAGSDCVPTDESLSLPPPCKTNGASNSPVSYVKLGSGMDYFANGFTDPLKRGVSLSVCQDLCFQNCSCMAIFHELSSGSCYLIENELGSIMMSSSATQKDRLGYIKTLVAPSVGNDEKRGFPKAGLVVLLSSGSVLILAVVLVATLWLRRKRKFGPTKVPKLERWNSSSSAEIEVISIPGLPVRFAYGELVAATENFKTQIGSGGFGTVYKGTLPDKAVVAVKKITSLGVRGKKEFFTEVSIIANIHHVNLVRLKGFCVYGSKRFLVFEFMNRGSLDRVLFGNGPVLEWQERFEIALGTARGLAYLHNGCDHKIIHCDVKPENILLHDNSQVKISDFGLSKLLGPEQSSLFTTMRGTRGYLAPEWLTSSSISDKADVYSYGMVLLEIVRGRKNNSLQTWCHIAQMDNSNGGGSSTSSSSTRSSSVERQVVYFPLLALEMHEQRRYLELADPSLEGRVSGEEVEKLIKIGLCCVQEDPALRPSMVNVVGMLEGALPLAEPRVESLNFLRFYGQRFTESASQVEGCNHQNEIISWKSSGSSGSCNSLSYISSQQLSGPR